MSLTVIIPTKSKYQNLAPTLKSLWQQNHNNFEVIVVISPPQPYLRRTLNKVRQTNSRLKILELDQPGTNLARNRGAEMAQGEIIYFLDDDCVLPTNEHLEKVENLFWEKENVVGVGGFYFTPNKATANCRAYNTIVNAWLLGGVEKKAPTLVGGCAAYKRDLFLKVGGFDDLVQGGGEELKLNEEMRKYGELHLDRRVSVLHSFNGPVSKFIKNSWSHGRGERAAETKAMSWRMRQEFLRQAIQVDKEMSLMDQVQLYSRVGVYGLGLRLGEASQQIQLQRNK